MWSLASLVVCAAFVSASLAAMTFDDSKKSYAQFEKWQLSSSSRGPEGKLSLYFKTHLRDSIILYQDDGNKDYVAVELSGGRVFASFGVSGKSVRIELGEDLDDMTWHTIRVHQNNQRIILTLDNRLSKSVAVVGQNNALVGRTGYLYIGGLPISLSLTALSWPQAAFKKRFVGCIKKVVMTNGDSPSQKATMVKSRGTKSGCLNKCRVHDPCLHNGKCINKFSKAICDCSGTAYEGETCQKEIIRLHLSVRDYVVYDMSTQPSATLQDHISLQFKTFKKNGILIETGFSQDFVQIKLSKGSLVLQWNLGSGTLEMSVGSKDLHDGYWHTVDIHRDMRMVNVSLDGGIAVQSSCPPYNSVFNMQGGIGKVFVGSGVSGSTTGRDSFEGCLGKVWFNGVDLLRKLKAEDSSLVLEGEADWSCAAVPTTVALTTVATTRAVKSTEIHKELTAMRKINRERDLPSRSIPKTKKKSTKRQPKATKDLRPTKCSPNDVLCGLNAKTSVIDPPTAAPITDSKKTPSCVQFKNCSGRMDKPSTDSPTGNATSEGDEPDVEGLQEERKELGNVPTAIGLVAASILLFVLCFFASYRFKKRRNAKHSIHEIKIEIREVERTEEGDGFDQDVHESN